MSWLDVIGEGLGSAVGTFQKARNETTTKKKNKQAQPAKGTLVDVFNPFQVTHGYQARPSGLDYDALRKIAMSFPIIAAIIRTRVNQAAAFAKVPKDDFDLGFRVKPRDDKQKMTKAVKKVADEITEFVLCCGEPDEGRDYTNDSLQSLIRKAVRDSLIFDQINLQVVPRLDGTPYEVLAMPAHTMRLSWDPRWNAAHPIADSAGFSQASGSVYRQTEIPKQDPNAPRYVQIYQNVPIADFTSYEMSWGVRNPRSDLEVGEYGYSELEELVGVLTQLASADSYNALLYLQGAMADGFLNFTEGNIPKDQIREFVRQWRIQVMGVENSHRMPVMNAPGLEWVTMGRMSQKDMEFSKYYDHLIRIVCANFQIDPAEINFVYGNVGQSSSLAQGGPEDKIKTSRDRGLRPIMSLLAQLLTQYIVRRFNDDFTLEFTGINPETEMERIDKLVKKTQHIITVNEAREELGYEAREDGDIILNQVWLQAKQGEQAAAQGAPGQEGPPAGPDEGQEGTRDDLLGFLGGGEDEGTPEARKSVTVHEFRL